MNKNLQAVTPLDVAKANRIEHNLGQNLKEAAICSTATEAIVDLQVMAAGYCRNAEFLTMRGGSLKPVAFPAGFALITHPKHGYILFDTGYAPRFFTETESFPQLLYRLVTPVTLEEQESAVRQLERRGIKAEQVNYVILSHFHGDHIAGLKDFPRATIVYKREAYAAVKELGDVAAVKAAYLPKLLPVDFAERSTFVEAMQQVTLPAGFPITNGYDLYGDGSLIAVDIPGHAAGQIGLFLRTTASQVFLCADAVWSSRAFRENRRPHAAARLIIDNYRDFMDTFQKICDLHQQHPYITIIPSHCSEALNDWQREVEP